MRICIDVSQTAYEGTGSGRYVVELLKGLLTLSTDYEFVLFGSAFKRKERLVALSNEHSVQTRISNKYFSLPPRFFELLWNSYHVLPVELFTGDIDVYHSSDWTQAPSKAKKVTTVHDMIPFLFPEHVHPRIKQAHELRWKHIIADDVTIIVDAESTRKDILSIFPSIQTSKIHTIPLACSQSYFDVGARKLDVSVQSEYRSDLTKVLNAYSLIESGYILSVGTLEPRKNIQRLIDAHSKLDSNLKKQFPLVIVGKKSWADSFESTEHVIFTGYVEESELPYLYAGAHCFVMPSLYEGFGIPVLEAMASATPVICSDRSSLPEIGGNDVHYIQDPEDSESIRMILQHILESDAEDLHAVALNAHTRALDFTWEVTARETLAVYEGLKKYE